jgi:hypothetical protein
VKSNDGSCRAEIVRDRQAVAHRFAARHFHHSTNRAPRFEWDPRFFRTYANSYQQVILHSDAGSFWDWLLIIGEIPGQARNDVADLRKSCSYYFCRSSSSEVSILEPFRDEGDSDVSLDRLLRADPEDERSISVRSI